MHILLDCPTGTSASIAGAKWPPTSCTWAGTCMNATQRCSGCCDDSIEDVDGRACAYTSPTCLKFTVLKPEGSLPHTQLQILSTAPCSPLAKMATDLNHDYKCQRRWKIDPLTGTRAYIASVKACDQASTPRSHIQCPLNHRRLWKAPGTRS